MADGRRDRFVDAGVSHWSFGPAGGTPPPPHTPGELLRGVVAALAAGDRATADHLLALARPDPDDEPIGESRSYTVVYEAEGAPPGKVMKTITYQRGGKTYTMKRLVNAPAAKKGRPKAKEKPEKAAVKRDAASVGPEKPAKPVDPLKYKTDASGSHVPLDSPDVIAAGAGHLSDPAFRKTLADAYNEQILYTDQQDGLVEIPRLVDEMQRRNPAITPAQVHEALAAIRARREASLFVANEVSSAKNRHLSVWDNDRLYHYVFAGHREGGLKGMDPDRLAPPPGSKAAPAAKPAGKEKPAKEGEPGFTGRDSLGREWADGKLVAAKEKPAKPAKAAKADPAATAKEVLAHLADPSGLTPGKVADLTAKMKTLTVPQIQAIQKERGVKGGTTKGDRVKRILDAARAKAANPAASPAGKPSRDELDRDVMRAYLAHADRGRTLGHSPDAMKVADELASRHGITRQEAYDHLRGMSDRDLLGLRVNNDPRVTHPGREHELMRTHAGQPVGWLGMNADHERNAKAVLAGPAAKAAPAESPHGKIRAGMDALGIAHSHLSDDQLHAMMSGGGGAAPAKEKAAAAVADDVVAFVTSWAREHTVGPPFHEIMKHLRARHPDITAGTFHDALRGLANASPPRLRLSDWQKTIHELPDPEVALFNKHTLAYYAHPTGASKAEPAKVPAGAGKTPPRPAWLADNPDVGGVFDLYEKASGRTRGIFETALQNAGVLDDAGDSVRPAGEEPEPLPGHDLRTHLAQRLAGGFGDQHKLGHTPEEVAPVAAALKRLGAKQVGEQGGTVPFDGSYHDGPAGVPTGGRVRVTRPGWSIPRPDGSGTIVLLKTLTEKPAAKPQKEPAVASPASAGRVSAAVGALTGHYENALDPSTNGKELREKAAAVVAGLTAAERRAVLTGMGYSNAKRSNDEVTELLTWHAAKRRGTFERADA